MSATMININVIRLTSNSYTWHLRIYVYINCILVRQARCACHPTKTTWTRHLRTYIYLYKLYFSPPGSLRLPSHQDYLNAATAQRLGELQGQNFQDFQDLRLCCMFFLTFFFLSNSNNYMINLIILVKKTVKAIKIWKVLKLLPENQSFVNL